MTRHPALISAQRAIALAPGDEKFRVLEREALTLRECVLRGELAKADVVDILCQAGGNVGLRLPEVEHVVLNGIKGVATLVSAGGTLCRGLLPGVGSAAALQGRSFPPLK